MVFFYFEIVLKKINIMKRTKKIQNLLFSSFYVNLLSSFVRIDPTCFWDTFILDKKKSWYNLNYYFFSF